MDLHRAVARPKPGAGAPRAAAPTGARRGKDLRDRWSVALFAALWSLALLRVAPDLFRVELLLALPMGVCLGHLLADLATGTVHWLADRCFDARTPVLGPLLIRPFRAHHETPAAITSHDFFELVGNAALVSLPLAVALFALPEPEGFATTLLFVTSAGFTLSAVATNVFHAWAHTPTPPPAARRLQRAGLILSRQGHARHHRGDHDRAYCVTAGWLNPTLDRLRLFPRLERLMRRRTASSPSLGFRSPPRRPS